MFKINAAKRKAILAKMHALAEAQAWLATMPLPLPPQISFLPSTSGQKLNKTWQMLNADAIAYQRRMRGMR